MDLLQRANELLVKIAAVSEQIAGVEARAEEEMKKVKERYAEPLGKFQEIRAALDDELVKMMKKHKGDIFETTDQVALEAGLLLYGEEEKVRIPRDAAAKLEELKWEDGLKRAVSVNREAIEKWPLERILTIGGDKKVVEIFSYELRTDQSDRTDRTTVNGER